MLEAMLNVFFKLSSRLKPELTLLSVIGQTYDVCRHML